MNLNRSFKKVLLLYCLILISSLFVIRPKEASGAAAKTSFTYTNLTTDTVVKYNNVSPKYYIDGEKFSTGKLKPIIISGYSMAPVSVFTDGCGVDYSYYSGSGNMIFKANGHTVTLTLGSKTAIVDGRATEMAVAPFRIKYKSSGKKTNLVPSQILSGFLEIGYKWTEATGSVDMTLPVPLVINGEYTYYLGTLGKITYNGQEISTARVPSYIFSSNAVVCINAIEKVIQGLNYEYDKTNDVITISYGDVEIIMHPDNTLVTVNGVMTNCPVPPQSIYNTETKLERLYVPGRFVFETLGFGYNWNSKTNTSEITLKENTGTYEFPFDDYVIYDSKSGISCIYVPTSASGQTAGSNHSYYQKLTVPFMEGIRLREVNIIEDLYNGCLTMELAGNYIDYYRKAKIKNSGEAVAQLQVLYYEPSDTTRINLYLQTDSKGLFLGHKVNYTTKGIEFTFDRPKNLFDKIIVLDAGHGGTDPGTVHGGYNEKDVNFRLVYTYCKELFDDSNIKVFYSRWDDTLPSLDNRAHVGERVGADFFISVHHNHNDRQSANGTGVYYSVKNTCDFKGLTGEIMAEKLCSNICDAVETNSWGKQRDNFTVISPANKVPAVLIEVGFMSNPDELKRVVTKKFQKKVAKAIYNTVLEFYDMVK